MKNRMIPALALLLAATACSDDPTRPRPVPETPAIELTPRLNVQLGDTPAGQQPEYIVTGNVSAKQGAAAVTAKIDSINMAYRINNGPWAVFAAPSQLPFSGRLPFTVTAGQHYTLWTALYATAWGSAGEKKSAVTEWTAEGNGY